MILLNISYYVLPLSLFAGIFLFAFLISSAGVIKGKDAPALNGLDRIYTDLYILLSAAALMPGALIYLDIERVLRGDIMQYMLFLIAAFYLYSIIMLGAMTFSKRIRSGSFLKNTIIYGLIMFGKEVFTNIGTVYQAGLAVIIFGIINILLLNNIRDGIASLAFLVFNLSVFGFVLYLSLQFDNLKKSVGQIAGGDLESKIDSSKLILGFKEQAEALNEISDGLNKALDEKMRSERFKTELITNVSHDIRTPLTSIINFIDLLKKEDLQNQKALEYLNVLEQKAQRLKDLIEDLMEASKASTGNITVLLNEINVNELVKQVTGEYHERLREKRLEIIHTLPKEKIIIEADRRHMWRILDNLLSNIKKYALPGTRMYIDLKTNEGLMNLTLRNISSEMLNISPEELMERFVRGDQARTTEGSGLGLSIVRSLTEIQGGTFDIKIKGDLFEVELCFPVKEIKSLL
ncbi:sensor histidine kinase [Candidatus Contubernalis alkaliaceticus]|uniref:sensor histidine kinase n=1 Tax=Candidatus Contubernalis alkaliaceticus TaxID=338645 RepID=UPI001F4C1574|nr:HAMP domain-containing sensor histidine kinase [Candidatus Contubernalis alkalaceticus]UNC93025.1 HAMP domain-containing histidine kinase [Candidatus Contubernalis alkalaceticus]